MRKGFYSLLKNKIMNLYAKDVVKMKKLNYIQKYLREWHDLYLENAVIKPQLEIANQYYLKKLFGNFKIGINQVGVKNRLNRSLNEKAYNFMSNKVSKRIFIAILLFS